MQVPCPGGCSDEVYCGAECAQRDWHQSHSALCTGPTASASRSAAQADALLEFYSLASATNDTLILAAKVLAAVQNEALRLLEQPGGAGAGCSAGSGLGGGQDARHWGALLEAWSPFALGHKALWWEIVPAAMDGADQCRRGARLPAAAAARALGSSISTPAGRCA